MENASKALIIAGEILIGVLILSLASYIIIQFGSFSKNMNEQMSAAEIRSFNVKFTSFSERANISMQEIATIVNFAKQSNNKYNAKPGDSYYVDVRIDGVSVLDDSIIGFLEDNKNTKYYSCNITLSQIDVQTLDNGNLTISAKKNNLNSDITYNEGTELVNMINFHEIDNTDYANALLQGATIIWKN